MESPSTSQPSFLMGYLGRPTITMVHFNFQKEFWDIFSTLPKKKIKCLLQSLQGDFDKDPTRITPPHLQAFGLQKLDH
jgi:hypothetical protein